MLKSLIAGAVIVGSVLGGETQPHHYVAMKNEPFGSTPIVNVGGKKYFVPYGAMGPHMLQVFDGDLQLYTEDDEGNPVAPVMVPETLQSEVAKSGPFLMEKRSTSIVVTVGATTVIDATVDFMKTETGFAEIKDFTMQIKDQKFWILVLASTGEQKALLYKQDGTKFDYSQTFSIPTVGTPTTVDDGFKPQFALMGAKDYMGVVCPVDNKMKVVYYNLTSVEFEFVDAVDIANPKLLKFMGSSLYWLNNGKDVVFTTVKNQTEISPVATKYSMEGLISYGIGSSFTYLASKDLVKLSAWDKKEKKFLFQEDIMINKDLVSSAEISEVVMDESTGLMFIGYGVGKESKTKNMFWVTMAAAEPKNADGIAAGIYIGFFFVILFFAKMDQGTWRNAFVLTAPFVYGGMIIMPLWLGAYITAGGEMESKEYSTTYELDHGYPFATIIFTIMMALSIVGLLVNIAFALVKRPESVSLVSAIAFGLLGSAFELEELGAAYSKIPEDMVASVPGFVLNAVLSLGLLILGIVGMSSTDYLDTHVLPIAPITPVLSSGVALLFAIGTFAYRKTQTDTRVGIA